MFRRSLCLTVTLIALCSVSGLSYDREEFLFLDEIEIGMAGIGKTIVSGDVISEFVVEVLGVIDQPGTLSDFIIVRVSGEAIGRSGGIAQGMSGSPVYVDGKMIGAISRAAHWSKAITPIGLVTPIELMLGVMDASDVARRVATPNPDAVLVGVRVTEGYEPANPVTVASAPGTIFACPVSTPILASGLSERALGVLMNGNSSQEAPPGVIADFLPPGIGPEIRGLASLNLSLIPVAASGIGSAIDPASLEPGSSLGIALTTGDVIIGALGTLTYRDSDLVIGFGHPFISNGESGFPLTTATIYDTMKSYEASFKLGSLGEPIGTILEDRMPGIGGRIGPAADLVAFTVHVTDFDRGATESFDIGMIDESRLIPQLLLATGFEAIDSTLDRIGQGTVEVTYQIHGHGMPAPLERRDTFLSVLDVAVYPPWQLANIVAALEYNAFDDPQITQITASMQVTEELKAIQINNLAIDSPIYAPGDTLAYEVELQTFHGERRVETGTIVIPEDLFSDYVLVRAYGGPRTIETGESPRSLESLEDLIELIEDLPSYETLTIELFAVDPFSAYSDALYGVTEVTIDFPGYVLYGEWEASALLLMPNEATELDG